MSHNNKQTSSSGIQGNYRTQLAKSHNNQIINIIMQNALKKKKKTKKNKPPPQEEQQPMPEPDTLENAAKRIPPNLYPPTNVITINPAGLPTPTMFDVQKQQQLNAYDNIKEMLRHEMASMRMDLANYTQNGGDPTTAQQIDTWLQQSEAAFANQNIQMPQQSFTLTNPESYQEYYDDQSSINSVNQQQQQQEEEIPTTNIINPEYDQNSEQSSEQISMASKYPSTKLPKTPQDNATPRPSTPPPQIQRVKSIIEESINTHGQKGVVRDRWQQNLSYLINADYKNMNKKDQKMHKASLKEYAQDYINDMINSKEKQNEAIKQLEQVFNKGKRITTQMKFLKQLLDVE